MRDTLTSPTVNCEPDQLYVASDLNLQRCRGTQRIMAPHINTPGDAGSDEKCLWLALRAAVLRLAISSWTAPPTPPAARFWRARGTCRSISLRPLHPLVVAGTVGIFAGKVNHS